jgi:mono/diheme cytochrome c family protein
MPYMKPWIRRIALGAAVLALVLVFAVAVVYAVSERNIRRTYDVPALATLQMPPADDADAVLARGEHLATAIGKCVKCHTLDLGGQVFIDDPAMGRIVATNLTTGRGGRLGGYDDAELERAIRHGVGLSGRALLFMPSREYYYLGEEDFAALAAYLRSLPPVDRELPASKVGPLGRTLYATGQLPLFSAEDIDHAAPRPQSPPQGVTREYGKYLANIGGCTGCHRPDLSGGRIPGRPPEFPAATNLTPAGIGTWTEADFFRAMRGGIRPDGSAIDPAMPWALTSRMTDDEIRAVWLYVSTVPAAEPQG